jgi:copper(I)-binding protein
VLLRGLKNGPLFPGESVPVTFTFAKAGQITLRVPVQLSVAPHNSIVPSVTNEATEAVN